VLPAVGLFLFAGRGTLGRMTLPGIPLPHSLAKAIGPIGPIGLALPTLAKPFPCRATGG
jgi:hypothetical protein